MGLCCCASLRHIFEFLTYGFYCWGFPVVTLPPSPGLPEQIGLGGKFIPCAITDLETHRLNLLSDELRLVRVGVYDSLPVGRSSATLTRNELISPFLLGSVLGSSNLHCSLKS